MQITVAGVRSNVAEVLHFSKEEKKRNFLETVESVLSSIQGHDEVS
jgi:hypothetical protein